MEEESETLSEHGSPPWMTSFCDLVVLMLCFFVLLSSFAKMDAGHFRSALGSMQKALGAEPLDATSSLVHPARPSSDAAPPARPRPNAATTLSRVREYLATRGLADRVEVSESERGIVLRAKDRVLFGSADVALDPEGIPILDAVASLCEGFEGHLSVEGHTDDRPIDSRMFPSNWELSGARAAAVVRYLLEAGVPPSMLHVSGYADTHPVASNASEQGRAQNRRVELVFEHPARDDAAAHSLAQD